MKAKDIFGVRIPDSKMAREVTQLIRDTESDLLFYHSTRVYFWGALTGKREGLMVDPELLYTGLCSTTLASHKVTVRAGSASK
jgi:hypothetical protein